jgi:glycosyltransferase involved in cell wall biosynthesis
VISLPFELHPDRSEGVIDPGFAIIVPIFRAIGVMDLPLAHLRRIIESAQRDVDVFLLDDASEDESLEVAREILKSPRIRLTLLRHASNRGECAAINTLADAAIERGHEWGLLLHQDDWLAPTWFEKCSILLRAAGRECAAIRPAYTAVRASPDDVSSMAFGSVVPGACTENKLRYVGRCSMGRWSEKGRFPFVGALLNLRWLQAVGGWVEGLPFAADVDFGCRLLEAGGTIEDHETTGILKIEHGRTSSALLSGSAVRSYCILAVVDRHPDLAAGRSTLRVALQHAVSIAMRAGKSVVRGRSPREVRGAAFLIAAFLRCVPYLALRKPFLAPSEFNALRARVFSARAVERL